MHGETKGPVQSGTTETGAAASAFVLHIKRLVGELVLADANSATVLVENARALGVI